MFVLHLSSWSIFTLVLAVKLFFFSIYADIRHIKSELIVSLWRSRVKFRNAALVSGIYRGLTSLWSFEFSSVQVVCSLLWTYRMKNSILIMFRYESFHGRFRTNKKELRWRARTFISISVCWVLPLKFACFLWRVCNKNSRKISQ
jgi:hypothetical protein